MINCVPPDRLFDVGIVFLCIGFGVGWIVGIVSGLIAVKRSPTLLVKLIGGGS